MKTYSLVYCFISINYIINGLGLFLFNQHAVSPFKIAIEYTTGLCNGINNQRSELLKESFQSRPINVLVYSNHKFLRYALSQIHNIIKLHNFNIKSNTLLYIHGFNARPAHKALEQMGDILHRRGYNLISLDLTEHLNGINYFYIAGLAQYISEAVADFLIKLCNHGLSSDKIHLVGLSLGAHISGMSANLLKKLYNKHIGRITALDLPALCFAIDPNKRLNKDDAKYVDVIYTSILSKGLDLSIGHSHYIVNSINGLQPGCQDIFCSHRRSLLIFMESVANEYGFLAKKCKSVLNDCDINITSYLGFSSNVTTRGIYVLNTNNKSPFALGLLGIV